MESRRYLPFVQWRRRTRLWLGVLAVGALVTAIAFWTRPNRADGFVATVARGDLDAVLTLTGVLRPLQSVTYRSHLGSRDVELTFLVAEGTRVGEGDLLARLDTTDLKQELDHTAQEIRQARVDLQVAEIDVQQGQAEIDSLVQGEGAVGVEEANTRVLLAERKVARLKGEVADLRPLMDKGFITRDELRRGEDELEQADQELAIARRRADVLVKQTHPQERRRADLQLEQKRAQVANVRARLLDAQARATRLTEQVESGDIYAQRPGLVVYEDYLSASPRRKIRAGDHVTGSQGIVTIPDVDRMVVDGSVAEAEVHRLKPGQRATVLLEAFPDMRLPAHLVRIGTLATTSAEGPLDEKRFAAVIELDEPNPSLRPEMSARADVVISERHNVLLVPINAVFQNNGSWVCFVVRRLGTEMRRVKIGEANQSLVEVEDGLALGELVSLVDLSRPTTGATPPAAPDPARPTGKPGGGS